MSVEAVPFSQHRVTETNLQQFTHVFFGVAGRKPRNQTEMAQPGKRARFGTKRSRIRILPPRREKASIGSFNWCSLAASPLPSP
jgi:hypothetical protein